ncbi:tubulin-tyrosine ligase family-domain-containing protein [Schizophyllum fasciatum]
MSESNSAGVAFVSWPTASFTESLVLKAIQRLSPPPQVVSSLSGITPDTKLLQWSTYDDMDHELTHLRRSSVLASSYVIRKALIRKHFLSRTIHAYLTKNPDSVLRDASPRTYEMEISYADELDEIFADELYDLEQDLEQGRWWILKPGMADRGNGIRIFNSKESLTQIFEEFEDDSEDEGDKKDVGTGVVTSQLRHFVVQEYIDRPLLLDPRERPIDASPFHLRAYCVASGAITLYLYDRILALFSSVPYTPPQSSASDSPSSIDLAPHLTNTSLQTHRGEEGVRLLDELVGPTFTQEHIDDIVQQISQILGETFKAALANPVHFQPVPNAFELFGVDFLVQHNPHADAPARRGSQHAPSEPPNPNLNPSPKLNAAQFPPRPFLVKLLEINAEPAIELTGPRLAWILKDLFVAIGERCVAPFFGGGEEGGEVEGGGSGREGESGRGDGVQKHGAQRPGARECQESSHFITCLQETRGG